MESGFFVLFAKHFYNDQKLMLYSNQYNPKNKDGFLRDDYLNIF